MRIQGSYQEKLTGRFSFPKRSEFYGQAPFQHPIPASVSELSTDYFPDIVDASYTASLIHPSRRGESLEGLHARVAYALHKLIAKLDGDPQGPKAILICTHAAAMIAIGRALTGQMPEDWDVDDFQCFTASCSVFRRRTGGESVQVQGEWDEGEPESIPDTKWKGRGVGGGWDCEKNADCSFLSGGEERGW